jgi:hypothetical protein
LPLASEASLTTVELNVGIRGDDAHRNTDHAPQA